MIDSPRQQLNQNLKTLASRAEKKLAKVYLGNRCRQLLRWLILSLAFFPIPLLLVEICRYAFGVEPFGLTVWHYTGIALIAAVLVFLSRLVWGYMALSIARHKSLALFDQQLKLANRLTIADEFMAVQQRTGFMDAAIDDAVAPAGKALKTELQPITDRRSIRLSRWSLASVPSAVALLLLTAWLGGIHLTSADVEASQPILLADSNSPRLEVLPDETQLLSEQSDRDSNKQMGTDGKGESNDGESPDSESGDTSRNTGGQAGRQAPQQNSAESQSGGTPAGPKSQAQSASAGSQQSAADGRQQRASSERAGQQASQQRQQVSSAGQQQEASGSKQKSSQSDQSAHSDNANQNSTADSRASKQARSQQGQQAGKGNSSSQNQSQSGSESQNQNQNQSQNQNQKQGQGQSRESQNQGQSQSQKGGESQQDQKQASKSSGGLPGGKKGSTTGDSRNGQGSANNEIKKNRGAAKAMLAMSVADHLIGAHSRGPEQIRQEESTPQREQVGQLPAGQRFQRSERIGELHHAKVSGWSRRLVENYFNQLRNHANSNNEGEKK